MRAVSGLLLADGPAVYRIVLHGEDEFKGDLVHSSELGDLIRANYMKDPSMTAWNGNDLIPVVGGKKGPKVFLIPRVGHQQK